MFSRNRDRSRAHEPLILGSSDPFAPLLARAGIQYAFRGDLGISLNGSAVAGWGDQSGNGRHLTQVTPANQPGLATPAAYNGKQVIRYASTNFLRSTSFSLASGFTVYVVGNVTGAVQAFMDNGDNTGAALLYADGTPNLRLAGTTEVVGPAINTSPHVMCAQFNGASSNLYFDNSGVASLSGVNCGTTTITAGIKVGRARTDVFHLVGDTALIFAYSGLDTLAQRQAFYAACASFYALPVS